MLFAFFICCSIFSSITSSLTPLPHSNTLHPTSGLIFQYLSQYSPTDTIIPLTVSIPLTRDMCFLIPYHALRRIPPCRRQNLTSVVFSRPKRLVADIIAIGVGSAALALSTANTAQIVKLQQQVNSVTDSLSMLNSATAAHSTQLLHLQEGQLKLALLLNSTQQSLNHSIRALQRQGAVLSHIGTFTQYLNTRITKVIYEIEAHFLHESLSEIFANQLNLDFIHPQDFAKVIDYVTSATQVTLHDDAHSIPAIDLISHLLIQQSIHFLPPPNNAPSSVIGLLSISSFFAATTQQPPTFSTYKLLPLPFYHAGQRVRLAAMPAVIGIDFIRSYFVSWSPQQALTCDFRLMSVCRETPVIVTNWSNSCLYQILNHSALSHCHTETHQDSIFYKRIGSQWAISLNAPITCQFIRFSNSTPPYILQNTPRTLPTVSIMTIPPHTSLTCPSFTIQASPTLQGSPMTIWDPTIFNNSLPDEFNLDQYLADMARWPKIPYITDELRAAYNYMVNNTMPPQLPTLRDVHRHPLGLLTLGTLVVVLGLIFILVYCHFHRRSPQPTVVFRNNPTPTIGFVN